MADKGLISKSILTDIADAIREKQGTVGTIQPSAMATTIENLPTGGVDFDDYDSEEVKEYLTEKKSSDETYCCDEDYVRSMSYYRLLNNDNYDNIQALYELPKLKELEYSFWGGGVQFLSEQQIEEIWNNYFTLVESFFTRNQYDRDFIDTKKQDSNHNDDGVYYFKDYYPCEDQDNDMDTWTQHTGYDFREHLAAYSPYVVFDGTDLNCLTTWMAHGYVYFEFPDFLDYFIDSSDEVVCDFSSIFYDFVSKVIPEGVAEYYFIVSSEHTKIGQQLFKYLNNLKTDTDAQDQVCSQLNNGKKVTLYLCTAPNSIFESVECNPSGGGSGS